MASSSWHFFLHSRLPKKVDEFFLRLSLRFWQVLWFHRRVSSVPLAFDRLKEGAYSISLTGLEIGLFRA
jgi:hypothetical protein